MWPPSVYHTTVAIPNTAVRKHLEKDMSAPCLGEKVDRNLPRHSADPSRMPAQILFEGPLDEALQVRR